MRFVHQHPSNPSRRAKNNKASVHELDYLRLMIFFVKIKSGNIKVKFDHYSIKIEMVLSSVEAAEVLEVHVSSIKRWSRAGKLKAERTPGGHRRFALETLLAFARQQQLAIALLKFAPYEAQVWEGLQQLRQGVIPEHLIALMYRWLREGQSGRLIRLVVFLYRRGVSVAALGDLLLGPLVGRIGVDWEAGRVGIGEEHRMTHMLIDALYALRLPEAEQEVPLALVACPESAHHELGALLVRLILEERGWRVLYLGADVPPEEVGWQQQQWRAELVALSFVPPLTRADVLRTLRVLGQLYDETRPYTLVLGGRGAAEAGDIHGPFRGIYVFQKLSDFARWLYDYTTHPQHA